MKIIVVDDEMSALHTFLTDVIGRTDVDYKFFKDDVEEIIGYVSKNSVAMAFLDITMPKINGLVLAERLIELDPNIQLVFITGLNVSKQDLAPTIRSHTVGFLYKPYDVDALERFLSRTVDGTACLTAQMFGAFDCFINDKIVKFSSQKSKELFALLLTYNGKTLTMSDAISQLWPDVDTDKSKPLYRDAVWRLRKTLNEINFNCINFSRAQLALDKQNIRCDYWDYLADPQTPHKGEFLKSYSWSSEYLVT